MMQSIKQILMTFNDCFQSTTDPEQRYFPPGSWQAQEEEYRRITARREEIRRQLHQPCAHDHVRVEVDGEVYCASRHCGMYLGYRKFKRRFPTQEELGRL